jgi:ElaB/YqjD/DUF883 family membrane-anchored ribosome-binding protein
MEPAINQRSQGQGQGKGQGQAQSQSQGRTQSLDHALKTLNEAAMTSAADIREMIKTSNYSQLSSVFSEARPQLSEAFNEIRNSLGERYSEVSEQVMSRGRESFQELDRRVHQDPWTYVAASAGIAALVSFLFSRRSRV